MKDTLREECDDIEDCLENCCINQENNVNIERWNRLHQCGQQCYSSVPQIFAPLFFVVFVLLAQFVLVNVVVAVLMKHLEETHKQVEYL